MKTDLKVTVTNFYMGFKEGDQLTSFLFSEIRRYGS